MVIFEMQGLHDALKKRRLGPKKPHSSIGRVTLALVFFFVTPLSFEVTADRYQYPVGYISQTELLDRHEVFKRNYDAYEVASGVDGLPPDLEVTILFGTWCHDSEREVPRMLKLLAASGLKKESISLIALDIRKSEPEGRAKALDVRFTPTFIFSRAGMELGRIVERPESSLRGDVATLIKSK